jgi:hypothetical protein
VGDLSKAANRDAIGLIASVDTNFDNEEVSSTVDRLVTSFQSNEDGRVIGEVRLETGNEDDGNEDDYGDDEFDDIADGSGQLEAVIQFVSPQNLPSSVTTVAVPSDRTVVLEGTETFGDGTEKSSPQIDSAVANTTAPQDDLDEHQDEYSHETFDQESLPTELVAVVPVRVASEQPVVVINDQVKDLLEENPIKIRGFYDDESLDNESERVRLRELHAQRLRESIIYHQEHPEKALAEDAVIHDDVAEADNIAEENAGDPNLRQWDLDRVFEEIRKHHADDISMPEPADDLLDHTMSIPRPLNSIVQDSHEEVLYNSVQSAMRKEAEANESKEENLQEQQEEVDASEYGGKDASEEEEEEEDDDDDDGELSNNPARNEAESFQQQSGDYSDFNIDDDDNSVIRQHDDEEENPNDGHDANTAPASALAQNNIPEPMESDGDSRKEDHRMDVDEKNGNGKEEEGEEEEEETYGDEEFEPEPETDSPNSSMLEPEPSRTHVNKELSRETMHQASLPLQPHPPTVARVSSSSNSTTTSSNSRGSGGENIGSGWTQRKLRPQSRPFSMTDQPEGVNKNAHVLEPSSPINQSTKPNHNASAFVDSRRNSLEDTTAGAFVRLDADGVGERGDANERSGATDAPRDVPDPAKLKIVKRNSLLRASAGFSAKSFDTSSNASSSPVPPGVLDAAESVSNVTKPTKHTSADSSMQKNQSISPNTIIQPAVSHTINYNDDDDDEGMYDFDMDFDAPVVPSVAAIAAPAASQPLKHPLRQIPPSSQQDTAEPISSVVLRLLNQRDEDDDALDGDDAIFGDDELFRFH